MKTLILILTGAIVIVISNLLLAKEIIRVGSNYCFTWKMILIKAPNLMWYRINFLRLNIEKISPQEASGIIFSCKKMKCIQNSKRIFLETFI